MPIYRVMPYYGTPRHEDEFSRIEEGPSILFDATLPLSPEEMLGDRVIFQGDDGQWWVKTAQIVAQGDPLAGFPRYFLFARPTARIGDEAKCARDREAGLVVVEGMTVRRLV